MALEEEGVTRWWEGEIDPFTLTDNGKWRFLEAENGNLMSFLLSGMVEIHFFVFCIAEMVSLGEVNSGNGYP